MTFGLAAMPMLLMMGAGVDYSRAVTTRSNLQQATDSTVLAIAHTYLTPSSTSSTLSGPTQTYLTGTMNTVAPGDGGTTTVTVNGVTGTLGAATLVTTTLSQHNTVMCIKTSMIIPTALMTIAGFKYMNVGAYSCSQVGGTYEVAMALDNSFSMSETLGSQTKMQALQQAATQLVNILIPPGTAAPTAAISLIPFNALVNVGTNTSASFLDTTGASSLSWIDVTKPAWVTAHTPSRLDLFNNMYTDNTKKTLATSWGGCIEERPNNSGRPGAPDTTNYMTTDVAATTGDSMFVPYFAPDDPGAVNGSPNSNFYNFSYESYPNSNNTFLNSYLTDNGASSAGGSCTAGDTYTTQDAKSTNQYGQSTNAYPGSGLTMSCKYNGSVPTIKTSSSNSQWFGLSVGPNENCSTPAITPLTTSNTNLVNAINAMTPTGLTNLGTGFMWAWRSISPVVNPFPAPSQVTIGQQTPKAYNYGPPPNTKVIILMTDGFNTWSPIINNNTTQSKINPFLSAYESFGYMTDNRLASYSTTQPSSSNTQALTGSNFVSTYANFRYQMDNMLLEACTNAKNNSAQNIIIYTVGFSISSDPIDAEGRTVLQACASNPGNYYEASDGSSIVAAFQKIAASITNLRISQ